MSCAKETYEPGRLTRPWMRPRRLLGPGPPSGPSSVRQQRQERRGLRICRGDRVVLFTSRAGGAPSNNATRVSFASYRTSQSGLHADRGRQRQTRPRFGRPPWCREVVARRRPPLAVRVAGAGRFRALDPSRKAALSSCAHAPSVAVSSVPVALAALPSRSSRVRWRDGLGGRACIWGRVGRISSVESRSSQRARLGLTPEEMAERSSWARARTSVGAGGNRGPPGALATAAPRRAVGISGLPVVTEGSVRRRCRCGCSRRWRAPPPVPAGAHRTCSGCG
jgi:hypothetical protein